MVLDIQVEACMFFSFSPLLFLKPIFYPLVPSGLLGFRQHIFPLNMQHIWPRLAAVAALVPWQIVGILLLRTSFASGAPEKLQPISQPVGAPQCYTSAAAKHTKGSMDQQTDRFIDQVSFSVKGEHQEAFCEPLCI